MTDYKVFKLLLVLIIPVQSFWWYLGTKEDISCDNSKLGLTENQLQECLSHKKYKAAIATGLKRGIEECKSQFAKRRWDCFTDNSNENLFGKIVGKDLKESSFIRSLMSASAIYGVIQTCSTGFLAMCGCRDMSNEADPKPGWSWGGCSDDLDNSVVAKTKKFINDPHVSTYHMGNDDIKNQLAVHNNKLGFQVVEDNMDIACKCQGLSGSCTVKTCYRRLPTISRLGKDLMNKYRYATLVDFYVFGSRGEVVWKPADQQDPRPTPRTMIFKSTRESEIFCYTNAEYSSRGTKGRVCNATSNESDNCNSLCCGRRFFDFTENIRYNCNCRFEYETLTTHCETCTNTISKQKCT